MVTPFLNRKLYFIRAQGLPFPLRCSANVASHLSSRPSPLGHCSSTGMSNSITTLGKQMWHIVQSREGCTYTMTQESFPGASLPGKLQQCAHSNRLTAAALLKNSIKVELTQIPTDRRRD